MPTAGSRRRRLIASVAALVAIASAGACGDGDGDGDQAGPAAATSAPPSTTAAPPPTYTCAASGSPGYRVRYPRSWYVNDPSEVRPCGYFHPTPFVVPPATEALGLAITISVEPVAFDRAAPEPDQAGPGEQITARETLRVGGRRAARLTTRATGDALLPAGTRTVRYVVDTGDGDTEQVLVASTTDISDADFDDSVEVLGTMVEGLELLTPDDAVCSAGAQPARVEAQPELPEEVKAIRARIVEAASQCDYDELSRLAVEGGGRFTHSFGAEGDPGAFWRSEEREGRRVLFTLVELLELPFGRRGVEGGAGPVVWPAAYAFDSWAAVPATERAQLQSIYGPEELAQFEAAGAYLGHRVGITPEGDWIFYVAGD